MELVKCEVMGIMGLSVTADVPILGNLQFSPHEVMRCPSAAVSNVFTFH